MQNPIKIIFTALCVSLLACTNDDENQPNVIDPSLIDDDAIGLKMEMPDKQTFVSRTAIGDEVTTIDDSWVVRVRAYGHMVKGVCDNKTMGIYDFGGGAVNDPQLESFDQPYNKTWALTWPAEGDDKRYAKWSYIWCENGGHTDGKGYYTVPGQGGYYAKGIRYIDIVAVGMAVQNNGWRLKFEYEGGEAQRAGCSNREFVIYPWDRNVSYKSESAHDVIVATSSDNDAKLKPVLNIKYKHVMSQLRFILKTDRTDITDANRFTFHFGYLPMWGIYDYVSDSWRNVTCSAGTNYYAGYNAGGLYLTSENIADGAKMGDTLGVIIIPGDYKTNKMMTYVDNVNLGANGNPNYVVNNPTVDNWIPMLYPAKPKTMGNGYDPMYSDNTDPYNPVHYMLGNFAGDVYEPGKIYEYNLNYTKDGVYITPLSVLDWDQSGMDSGMSLQSVD